MVILSLALRIIVSLFNDSKTISFVTGAGGLRKDVQNAY
jgi:hypothetical protein